MADIVDRITRWLETSYEPDPPNDALLMIDARREIERLRAEATIKVSRSDDLHDELKRLGIAVDAVLLATVDKGSHPEYHDEVRRRHEREWPTLWRAIAALREARCG